MLQKAFTLIELLVVIAVIGILSGLIVVSMNGVTNKATIAKSQIFSNSLRNSLMINLVSEWKFDGATTERTATNTDVIDTWKNTNNGVIPSSPSIPTTKTASSCISGSCLSFDGNDYVRIPYSASLAPTDVITFSAWASMTTWNGDGAIISKKEAGGYAIDIVSTNLRLQLNRGSSYATITTPLSGISSGWHFLTGTYDGRYTKLYVDAVMKTSDDAGSILPITYIHNNSLFIGAEAMDADIPTTPYFSGLIDDIRIFNAAMPSSQIKEQYYVGLNSLLTNGEITNKEYLSRISVATLNKKPRI